MVDSPSHELPQVTSGVLKVDDNFRDKCAVDMKGMQFPLPEQLENGYPPLKSLEELDETVVWKPNMILIDSPRSVEACLRLGINPPELLKTKLTIPAGTDPNLAKMQYIRLERRRKQKLKALKEERHRLMEEGTTTQQTEQDGTVISTMLLQAQQRMEKIQQANKSQVKQQVAYDVRMKEKVREREKKVADQVALDEAHKQRKQEDARRKQEQREAQHLRMQRAKEEERQHRLQSIAERQGDYETKEQRMRERNAEKQAELELEHELNRRKAAARQQVIKELSQQILDERRQMYDDKQQRADESRRAFEEFRDEQANRRRQNALAKEQRIKAALQRGQDIENYKIALALAKQEQAENARKKYEEERTQYQELKKQREEEKESRRKEIYDSAKEEEQRKIDKFLARQAAVEQNQQRLKEKADYLKSLRMLDQQLLQEEKRENVERMHKIYEYQKFKTLEKIDSKIKKSEYIAAQTEELKKLRKEQRDEVEKNKAFFEQTSPGPGDYLGTYPPVPDKRPRCFNFGLARDDVFLPEAGKDSPGPAAYASDSKEARKAWSMPKADRFTAVSDKLGKGRKLIIPIGVRLDGGGI